jgi:hypothetical protein
MNPIKNKNRMKKNILLFGLIGALTAILAAVSCKPDYETEFEVKTLVVPDKDLAPVLFTMEGGTREIVVETNVALSGWSASSNAEWLTVEQKEGKVTLSAGDYRDSYVSRIARVTIEYGHQTYSIDVTQAAGKVSTLSIESLEVEPEEWKGIIPVNTTGLENYRVRITSSMKEVCILIPDTAINFVDYDDEQRDEEGNKIVVFTIAKNTGKKRYCTVTFQSPDNYDHTASLLISQQGLVEIKLIPEMLSTNAQESTEGPIANLVDGNPGSYFHSTWSGGGGGITEAHYFQVILDKPINGGCAFWYQNRNNSNGKPQDVSIMISADGENWRELTRLTSGLPTGGGSTYESDSFTVDEPFKYFRFVVNRTSDGNAPTFFSLAEFKLYYIED